MNRYRVLHVTEFQYDGPVSESYNEVRLRPRDDAGQSCISFRLTTDPFSRPSSHLDHLGNWVHQFNVMPEHRRLRVSAESVVLVQDPAAFPDNGSRLDQLHQFADELDDEFDLLAPTEFTPHLEEVRPLMEAAEGQSGGSVSAFAQASADLIHTRFRYEKGATHVQSSIHDILATGAGVCQDFAHLLLSILRLRGLPARYVSGYLIPSSAAAPGASVEEIIGGQASHAWAEVLIPGAGWRGLDPTLGKPIGLRHVRVAYGRDYGDVAPLRGVYKGHAGQRLHVDVCVRPALDHEGWELLQETAAGPATPAPIEEPPQQQQQQQQ